MASLIEKYVSNSFELDATSAQIERLQARFEAESGAVQAQIAKRLRGLQDYMKSLEQAIDKQMIGIAALEKASPISFWEEMKRQNEALTWRRKRQAAMLAAA